MGALMGYSKYEARHNNYVGIGLQVITNVCLANIGYSLKQPAFTAA
jgi:hypothetical protein